MAIGEFGGAPAPIGEFGGAAPASGGPALSNGLYWMYEAGHAALQPARMLADVTRLAFKNPLNPLAHPTYGKSMAAAAELFERSTRRYAKPTWGIDSVLIGGERAPINITTVWERPFCRLLHFERMFCHMPRRPQPKLLIVAPMSGHYATLLRGTVEAFLPNHDVYITYWTEARMVPVTDGRGKLTPEVLAHIEQRRREQPDWRARDVQTELQQHFGLTIHRRSLERVLHGKKKSQHP